jgi:hypothetical protein
LPIALDLCGFALRKFCVGIKTGIDQVEMLIGFAGQLVDLALQG